jgi:proliferating cell nuclear antigen
MSSAANAGPSGVPEDDRDHALTPATDADAAVSILTHGDPIRSFTELLSPIADEWRIHFDDDGLSARGVDPANVAMLDVAAPAEGFDAFEVRDDHTFGLNLDQFSGAVGWARKRGNGDPVAIDVFRDPSRMRVTVVRDDQQMKRETEWFGIDPDSIRTEPNSPSFNLPLKARPGVEPLRDAVKAVKSTAHCAYVTCDGAAFKVATTEDGTTDLLQDDRDNVEDAISFPNAVTSEDTDARSSVFSLDYLDDITKGLKKSKADRVTVRWGQEFPTRLKFEHDDWGFEGHFMLAPRIQSED